MKKETLKIRVSKIQEHAHIIGQPDYYTEYVAQGTMIEGGKFLIVSPAVRTAMKAKYKERGLGDYIAKIAKPAARVIKTVTGGVVDYTNCGKCPERQEKLNGLFPAKQEGS